MPTVRYKEISEELEKKIRLGELTGRLPGIIKLTTDYSAGQATIKKAVKDLIDRGFLTVDGTRGTFISSQAPSEKRYGVIGLIGKVFNENENGVILEKLNQYSASKGYSVLQISNLDSLVKSRPQVLKDIPCDGFLAFGVTPELIAAIRQQGKKLVSLHACEDIPGVSWADYNWEPQIEAVLRRFVELGHRRIAFAMWDNNRFGFRQRMFELYRRVLEDLGVFNSDYFYSSLDINALFKEHGAAYSEVTGKLLASHFQAFTEPPTCAYLHFGTPEVYPFIKALKQYQINVPDDFSLVYVGNEVDKSTSCLCMDCIDLVKGAMDMLIKQFQPDNSTFQTYLSSVELTNEATVKPLNRNLVLEDV